MQYALVKQFCNITSNS